MVWQLMRVETTSELLQELEEIAAKDVEIRRLLRQLLLDVVGTSTLELIWSPHTSERAERDAERSRAHDSFIDSCNVLSRSMQTRGATNSERGKIGEDRKTIGDFEVKPQGRLRKVYAPELPFCKTRAPCIASFRIGWGWRGESRGLHGFRPSALPRSS